MPEYTKEQIADIESREKEALETLKRLELTPSAVVQKINTGGDVFADKVIPYLKDIKYAKKPEVVSPIQKDDLGDKDVPEVA